MGPWFARGTEVNGDAVEYPERRTKRGAVRDAKRSAEADKTTGKLRKYTVSKRDS